MAVSPFCTSGQSYKKNHGDTTVEKALLWKITRNDLAQTSYLYATSHRICTYQIDTPLVLISAFRSCNRLLIEIADTLPPTLTYNIPIKELVGKWYFKEIRKAIRNVYPNEPDSSSKYRLPPFAYIDLLVGDLMSCPVTSVEKTLVAMAKRNNMPVQGLETNRDRDSLVNFPKLSLQQQAYQLADFIDHKPAYRHSLEQFDAFYRDHDITNLYEISAYLPLGRGTRKMDLSNAILDERNDLWVPRMEALMKEGPIFFAVGCAHFAGSHGLISLLRQEGYTLTPLF
jgi:uncharacterized protein YbaP (TraB family)